MTVDVATLGLDVDTRKLKAAERDQDRFARSAEGMERRTRKATDSIGLGFGAMGRAAASAAVALAGLAAGAVSLGVALRDARQFGAAIAEVTTLMSNSASETALLEKNARALGVAYGTGATPQVRAFYQAISAGAGDVASATTLLDQANKLAIGGATDVTTAVDILTTATNVYKDSGLTAAEASDALFVAMRAGKTTIGELSASLGKVLPIANSLGVSFDEVASATAALTLGGISTAESVTGLRAAMASILGPTKQASDLAKTLGLEFNAAGLETLGFAGFMEEVVRKTGGSSEAMQKLFGSVEAVTVALALSGAAGQSLGNILASMANKAGETDKAFRKMADTFDQRLNRATAALADIGLRVGNLLLTVLVPALEAVVKVATFLSDNASGLGVVLVGLAATQIPAAIAALAKITAGMTLATAATGAFTKAVALARLGVIALGGPIGILFGLIGTAAAAFVAFGNDTQNTASAMSTAETAARDLAIELEQMADSDLPNASKATVQLANDNLAGARAARENAKAQNELAIAALRAADAQLDSEAFSSIESDLLPGQVARRQALENLLSSQRALAQAEEELNNRVFEGNQIVTQSAELIERNAASTNELATSTSAAGRAIAGTADEMMRTADALNEAADPMLAYTRRLSEIEAMKPHLTARAYAKAMKEANDELANSNPLVNSLTDAWGDFAMRGFKDFTGFARSVLDVFKNMLRDMIVMAARNRIMFSMGFGGSGVGSMASAGTSLLGGGGGGGMLSGVGGLAGLGSAFMGGAGFFTSGVASGFAAGGIGGAISGGGTAIATALSGATGGLGGLAAAAGAVALPLAAAALVIGLFSKKVKTSFREIDSGVSGIVRGLDVSVKNFRTVEKTVTTSRFFGLSKKTRTTTSTVSRDDPDSPFIEAVGQVQQSILDAAKSLGIGADAFNGFTYSFRLSLQGLTDDQKTQKINEELTRMGDAFAGMLPQFSSMNELLQAAEQRFTIENRLLELQGKSAEVLARNRERELAATHEVNRSILEQVFALEDQAAAAQKAADRMNAMMQGNLFETAADRQFAATSFGFTRNLGGQLSGEERALLNEIVTAVREGNINQARLLTDLKRIEERRDLEPAP